MPAARHHGGLRGGSSRDEYCRGRLLFPLTNHPPMSRGGRAAMFYSSSADRVDTSRSSRLVCAREAVSSPKEPSSRPMARHIVAIMCRKSCLIEANGRCKGFPRIIVNVAVACNKINQLHVDSTQFLSSTWKSVKSTYTLYPDTLVYFRILRINKYIIENSNRELQFFNVINLSYLRSPS